MESFNSQHYEKNVWMEEEGEYPLRENNNINNNEEEEGTIISDLEESKRYKRQKELNTSASSPLTYDSSVSHSIHDPFSIPLLHDERDVHATWDSEEGQDRGESMGKLLSPGPPHPTASISSTGKEESMGLAEETVFARGTNDSMISRGKTVVEGEEVVVVGRGEKEWSEGEEYLTVGEVNHLYTSWNEDSRMVGDNSTEVMKEGMEEWWETEEEEEEGKKDNRENQSLAELYGLEAVTDEEEEEENGGGEDGDRMEVDSLDDDDEEEEGDGGGGIYSLRYTPAHPHPSRPLLSTSRQVEDGLSAHRVRQLLRYEGSSSILSKEAVAGVAKAVSLMMQDLIRTAATFSQRRHRQRVTASEIAQVISLYDRFSFLADVIPLPEKKIGTGVARPLRSGNGHTTTTTTTTSSSSSRSGNGGGILSMMMNQSRGGPTMVPMDSWVRRSEDVQDGVREVKDGVKKKVGESLGEAYSSKNLLDGAFGFTIESKENEVEKEGQNASLHRNSNRGGETAEGREKDTTFSPPSFPRPSDFPKSNRTQQSTLRF